jgi:hypothetical protein
MHRRATGDMSLTANILCAIVEVAEAEIAVEAEIVVVIVNGSHTDIVIC